MRLTFLVKLFYIANILFLITACNKKTEPPFGGYFTVQVDTNEWKIIQQSENKLDEGPVKYLYQMKADSGYFLDITVYNVQEEYTMSSDSIEFFEQTRHSKSGEGQKFILGEIKVINNIHYRSSLFYQKENLERATFTGHLGKKTYVTLFNLFYNHGASDGAVRYNHDSMTSQFVKILKSFKDLSNE
ncbi:MAG: hypothetical protein ABUK01_01965 [Leptospirales bacterium]